MNRVFSVGELAIALHPTGYFEYRNELVLITEDLHIRTCRCRWDKESLERAYYYGVRFTDGVTAYAQPHQLKKLNEDDHETLVQLAAKDRRKRVKKNRVCFDFKDGSSAIIEDYTAAQSAVDY